MFYKHFFTGHPRFHALSSTTTFGEIMNNVVANSSMVSAQFLRNVPILRYIKYNYSPYCGNPYCGIFYVALYRPIDLRTCTSCSNNK